MSCTVHPSIETVGTCEYCGQPHCAHCLQPLLGRRYCPGCYARVAGIARLPSAGRGPGGAPVTAPRESAPTRARLPGWASVLLYLIGFVILDTGVQFVLLAALQIARLASGHPHPHSRATGLDLMDASGIGLPAWSLLFGFFGWLSLLLVVGYTALMSHGIERRKLAELGLRWTRRVARDAALGLALAMVLFVSVVGVGLSLGWYRLTAISDPTSSLLTAVGGLLILLPFAAVEEVSMRGYVQHVGARSWGKWGGLLASSLVFAALHLLNPEIGKHPLAVVGLLLAGLYLGSAALITGDLWLAIFLHAGWNLMEGPFFGLPVSGMEVPTSILRTSAPGADLLTGGTFGPEGGLVLCLLMAIHLAALWTVRPLLARRQDSGAHPPVPSPPVELESYQATSTP